MADKSHWEVDPFDWSEIWVRLIGDFVESPRDTAIIADKIFGGERHIHYGVRCLEVGAGVGRLLLEGQKRYHYAFGLDSSKTMVAASTRYLQNAPRCRVILNDGADFPFEDNYFDFVYSYTCFQHIPKLETIRANLKEIYRVLDAKGSCKIQTVCGENGTGRHDGYVFRTVGDFSAEFLKAGFNGVQVAHEGEWLWATAKK